MLIPLLSVGLVAYTHSSGVVESMNDRLWSIPAAVQVPSREYLFSKIRLCHPLMIPSFTQVYIPHHLPPILRLIYRVCRKDENLHTLVTYIVEPKSGSPKLVLIKYHSWNS